MCGGCVLDYAAKDDRILAAARAAQALYALEGGDVGGPAHVVLENTNVEDDHLDSAMQYARDTEHFAWTAEVIAATDAVIAALRPLTMLERAVVSAWHEEIVDRVESGWI